MTDLHLNIHIAFPLAFRLELKAEKLKSKSPNKKTCSETGRSLEQKNQHQVSLAGMTFFKDLPLCGVFLNFFFVFGVEKGV